MRLEERLHSTNLLIVSSVLILKNSKIFQIIYDCLNKTTHPSLKWCKPFYSSKIILYESPIIKNKYLKIDNLDIKNHKTRFCLKTYAIYLSSVFFPMDAGAVGKNSLHTTIKKINSQTLSGSTFSGKDLKVLLNSVVKFTKRAFITTHFYYRK